MARSWSESNYTSLESCNDNPTMVRASIEIITLYTWAGFSLLKTCAPQTVDNYLLPVEQVDDSKSICLLALLCYGHMFLELLNLLEPRWQACHQLIPGELVARCDLISFHYHTDMTDVSTGIPVVAVGSWNTNSHSFGCSSEANVFFVILFCS